MSSIDPTTDTPERQFPDAGPLRPGAFGYPAPVSDLYDHDEYRWCLTGDEPPVKDTIQSWGHCRDFCQASDSPQTDGLTVTEHGPLCRSLSLGYIDGTTVSGGRFTINANLVEEYRHGTYAKADTWGRPPRQAEVQLALTGDCVIPNEYEAALANISVGDARRLAAALLRLADAADHLTLDVLAAKSDRAGR